MARDHRDPRVREIVTRIGDETVDDLHSLEELMTLVGTSPSVLKDLPAKAAEKVAQLKPNRRVAERSPLSDLIELEALTLAVTGKKLGFKALLDIGDPRPPRATTGGAPRGPPGPAGRPGAARAWPAPSPSGRRAARRRAGAASPGWYGSRSPARCRPCGGGS